jgi:hypothetical protein
VNSPRLWVAILAVVCFLAGSATGLLYASATRPPASSGGPFDEYKRAFCERFKLDAQRTKLFDDLMRNYHKEIEDVRQRALANSLAEMEPQLVKLGDRYRDVIRDHALPENQRAEFDALSNAFNPLP